MKTIRIMVDYYSFPLGDNSDNLDPECVPISKILEEKHDVLLNMDDPSLSGFKIQDNKKMVEGLLLARDLKKELGNYFNIEYWSYYETSVTPFGKNRKFTVCM